MANFSFFSGGAPAPDMQMPNFKFDPSTHHVANRNTFVSSSQDITHEIEQWRGILERLLVEHTGLVTVRRRAPQTFTDEMRRRLQNLEKAREKATTLLSGYLDRFLPVWSFGHDQAHSGGRLREPSSTSSGPPAPPPSPIESDDGSTKAGDIRMEGPPMTHFEIPGSQDYTEYKARLKSNPAEMEACLRREVERAPEARKAGGFTFGGAPPEVMEARLRDDPEGAKKHPGGNFMLNEGSASVLAVEEDEIPTKSEGGFVFGTRHVLPEVSAGAAAAALNEDPSRKGFTNCFPIDDMPESVLVKNA